VNTGIQFDVLKSVHHRTIQINQPTRCNSFTSLLFDVYVWLNMFRVPLRPSSGAYNCTRSLWFYRWRMAVGALLVVVWQAIARNPMCSVYSTNTYMASVSPDFRGRSCRKWPSWSINNRLMNQGRILYITPDKEKFYKGGEGWFNEKHYIYKMMSTCWTHASSLAYGIHCTPIADKINKK
jgi:hypothetical protein